MRAYENEFNQTIKEIIGSIVQRIPNPIPQDLEPNPDRLDVNLRTTRDIPLKHLTPGEMSGVTWCDTELQREIRRWSNAPGNLNVGVYKPDTAFILDYASPHNPSMLSMISLVGEVKVQRLNSQGQAERGSEAEWSELTEAIPRTEDGAVKGEKVKWKIALARGIIYLLTANQNCGTWLGNIYVGSKFSRMCMLSDGTIALECASTYLDDRDGERSTLASEFLSEADNMTHLAHDLSRPVGQSVKIEPSKSSTRLMSMRSNSS